METFCYLVDTVGARRNAVDSVITRIKKKLIKVRDLVPFLASRGLILGGNGRSYSACAHSGALYEREIWPVKEEDVIRLERDDVRMVRWMCSDRLEYKISAEELRTRLKLKSMKECSQDTRLEWFGHLEKIGESLV